jgi:hypothetical protein
VRYCVVRGRNDINNLGIIRWRFKLNRLRNWVAGSIDVCFTALAHIESLIGAWVN